MRRYDQSVRVMTAFFAALLGFGLKNLLDSKYLPKDMVPPCFVLSVLLFLRFLVGSANHYWCDFVNTDTVPADVSRPWLKKSQPTRSATVLLDYLALVVFGLLGAFTCYATTIHGILSGHLAIAFLGIIWSLLYIHRSKSSNHPRTWVSVAWQLVAVNLVQILAIVLGWLSIVYTASVEFLPLPEWSWFPWPLWDSRLTVLVVVYFLLLAWDLHGQFTQLQSAESS